MQTTLAIGLDLLAAAAAPDGTRRDFRLGAIAVSSCGRAHPGNGPRSPENAAVPQILDLLSHCLAPEPAASSAAELPHLVTGMFRTVFEFTSPESGLPHPTAALLYERITRAGERSLEPGWRGRAQERLARDVEQWLSEASPAPGTKDSFRALGRPGAALRNSLLRRSRLDWSRPGRT